MGGCAKHMMHPYDNLGITFDELADLICKVGSASIKAYEKVDGTNIHWSLAEDNEPRFALNMGQLIKGGLTIDEFSEWLKHHPGRAQFMAGAMELYSRKFKTHGGIPWHFKKDLSLWVNTEIISKANPQCLEYDHDCLVFHDLVEYSPEQKKCVSVASEHSWGWSSFIVETTGCKSYDWKTYHKLDVKLSANFRAVQTYLSKLHEIMDYWKLSPNDTLKTYYAKITSKELSQWLPRAAAQAVVENVWYGGKSNVRYIRQELVDWAPMTRFNRIALSKHRAGYQGECKREMKLLFDSFGAEMIQDTKSNLIEDSSRQKKLMLSKMEKSMEEVKAFHNTMNDDVSGTLLSKTEEELERFTRLKVSPPSMEGIVFEMYHGKYKLTGAFPSMNRVAGAARYGIK